MNPFPTALVVMLAAAAGAHAEDSQAVRDARWHDVAKIIFNGRAMTDGSQALQIDAPVRALDAALVPVSITVQPNLTPKALYLVIDDNPAPVAGIVHFGPAADPHVLKLRVRVDHYTLMHAVAEMPDGRLLAVARYIKAAGGCSAPGTEVSAGAMARLGRMKLTIRGDDRPGTAHSVIAQLLISHPNFNGMQMDPVTRFYTPARYVRSVSVSQGGRQVFTMEGDISLSQDPAITFGFVPGPVADAPLDVAVEDSSKAIFRQSFQVGGHQS
jgi:sulfur-oxidizing protein SoxY